MDDLVKRFERAVRESMHPQANEANRAFVESLRCELADTIERLSAEKSELKNKVDFLEGVMACDQIVSNELTARIAALESGQPTEVNGESWQLVPVELDGSPLAMVASALATDDGADPGTLIWQGNPPEPWGEVWRGYTGAAKAAHAAMLTASAQEMALQALATQAQELGMGYDDERKV